MEQLSIPPPKELARRAIEHLPVDATLEDIMERLYFLHNLIKALKQSEIGEGISQSEMEARVESWFTEK